MNNMDHQSARHAIAQSQHVGLFVRIPHHVMTSARPGTRYRLTKALLHRPASTRMLVAITLKCDGARTPFLARFLWTNPFMWTRARWGSAWHLLPELYSRGQQCCSSTMVASPIGRASSGRSQRAARG